MVNSIGRIQTHNFIKKRSSIINNNILLIYFLFSISLSSQEISTLINIPCDDYFTLATAEAKVKKQFPNASIASFKADSNIIIYPNQVYVSYGDRNLHTDIFMPKQNHNGLLPAIIFIHGGGWRSGNRSLQIPLAKKVAGKGYVTFTVEYRLSPEAKYPAAIYDIKALVRWIRSNAGFYNIDTNKIAACGSSAGGHLATLIGVTNNRNKFEGDLGNLNYSSKINAIINIDGPLDLTHPEESFEKSDISKPTSVMRWLGYSFNEKPELWMEASSINYVNENTPPIVFINSSLEKYHVGRDYMIEKLKQYNIYYELNTIPNSPHTIWLFNPWFDKTFGYVNEFLKTVFSKND